MKGIRSYQYRPLLVSVCTLLLFLWLALWAGRAHSQDSMTYIDDSDIDPSQILVKDAFRGYRLTSPEFFEVVHHHGENVGIPTEIFIKVAKATPAVRETMNNPDMASFQDWYESTKGVHFMTSGDIRGPDVVKISTGDIGIEMDPTWMLNLHDTELAIDPTPITYTALVGGNEVEFFEVNGAAFRTLQQSYDEWNHAATLPSADYPMRMSSAHARLANYPVLAAKTEIKLG